MAYLDKNGVSKLWAKVKALFNKGVTDISINGKTVTITKGDGSTSTQTTKDTEYSVFKGATNSADGSNGLVPAPKSGKQDSFLKGDGTWGTPENTKYSVVSKTAAGLAPQLPNETSTTKYLRQDGTWAVPPNQTYNKATQSSDGLMAKEDKTKLDGIEEGAQKNVVSYGSVSVDDGLPMGAVQPNDTLSIKSGDNVTVEVVSDGGGGDGNSLKISAKDTTYNDATQSSHGLMTASDKTKLDGLPSMAELNSNFLRKETASSTFLSKADASSTYLTQTDANNTYAKKSDITNMYVYKGSVADASKLPKTGQQVGWVYNIESASVYGGAGMNVAWNGTAWDPLGEIFTITAITNEELDEICV